MMYQIAKVNVCKIGFVFTSIMLLAVSSANSADLTAKQTKSSSTQSNTKIDPAGWGKIVEAAKKEGRVVYLFGLGQQAETSG